MLTRALCHADNCYFLPNVRFRGLPCKTNTVSNTAFRGYGGPQGMLAIETVIEAVARQLGLPVHTVRRRNFYGIGRNRVTRALHQIGVEQARTHGKWSCVKNPYGDPSYALPYGFQCHRSRAIFLR